MPISSRMDYMCGGIWSLYPKRGADAQRRCKLIYESVMRMHSGFCVARYAYECCKTWLLFIVCHQTSSFLQTYALLNPLVVFLRLKYLALNLICIMWGLCGINNTSRDERLNTWGTSVSIVSQYPGCCVQFHQFLCSQLSLQQVCSPLRSQ
jgi:hypothetical protein